MGFWRLYKRKITAFYLILPLILSACYTYSKGPLVSSDEIPNSKQIISKEYKTTIISKPEPRNPVLTLKIEEKIKYRAQVVNKYSKVKKSLTGFNLGIPLMAISTLIKNDSIKITLIVISSLLILWDLIELANSTPYMRSTDQFIYDKPQYVVKETTFYPAGNSYINVTLSAPGQNLQKKIFCDYNGIAQINFYDFLPNYKFTSDKDLIEISIWKDNSALNKFSFYSSEISLPFAEIKIDKISIFEAPTGGSKKLYEASKGESFPIISTSKDWVQIELKTGKNGWIPSIGVNVTRKIYKPK